MCQCVARPAGDDEDGVHLSGVCREEELPIEVGVDVLSNRRYNQLQLFVPSHSKFPGLRRTPIGYLAGFLFQDKKQGTSFGIMHRYRYERSRTIGKQYIELFLLIKLVIIKLERKRKKTKKNICMNLRATSMA